jgi:biopolymer transport protein ExbD
VYPPEIAFKLYNHFTSNPFFEVKMFRFRSEAAEEKPELIIIPMVDVMLFLLAFFVLITGSIIPGLAMKTTPPETIQKSSFKPRREVVTVIIKKDGSFWYGKEKLTFDQLVRLLKGFKKKNPQVSLAINADRDSSVQSLVNVLDAAQKAGINSIGLIAKERDEGTH